MAISSPINLNKVNQSVRPNSKQSSNAEQSVRRVQGILFNKRKVKKEIFDRKSKIKNQRIEREKRKRKEEELESPNLVVKTGGPIQLIQSSAKGFLERLLGFLGYLTAGWIMNNLPTWIAMGKEFIGRVKRMGQLIFGFVSNIKNTFVGFGNLLNATFQNLIQFDLFDSSNRVKDAFGQLTGSIDEMGRELEESIKLLTTPLSEGLITGQDAPLTGQERTSEGAYEPGAPMQVPSTPSGNISTTQKQALNILSKYESASSGGYNAVNQIGTKGGRGVLGYSGDFRNMKQHRGKALTDMTIAEIMSLQAPRPGMSNQEWIRQGRLHAVGRYQFIGGTLPGVVSRSGIPTNAKFTSEVQDLLALQYLKEAGIGAWIGPADKATRQERAIIERARREPINYRPPVSQSSGSSQPRISTTTPAAGQSFRPLPQGSFKDSPSQRYLASRDRGNRSHLGIDITENNWKRGTDPRIPVVAIRGGVVSQRYYLGGSEYESGLLIDQDDGYSIRYLHMSPSVRPGQKVSAGQRIGRLVDLGDQTHLHIELYVGNKRLDPTDYIKTIERGGTPRSIAQTQRSQQTPAQISSRQTPQQRQEAVQQLAQERTGPTIIVTEPPQPEPPVIVQGGGSQDDMISIGADDFTVLNNFIKNKLLLDLAYL